MTELRKLSLKKIRQAGGLRKGAVVDFDFGSFDVIVLSYRDHLHILQRNAHFKNMFSVNLTYLDDNRAYFICPVLGVRCSALYFIDNQLCSRKAARLDYESRVGPGALVIPRRSEQPHA